MTPKLWTLPPFVMVLGGMGLVWSRYDSPPARIPVHWGLNGADRWADKSAGTVLMPGLIGLGVLAIMAWKASRLETAGQVWRKVALAWLVGVVVAVLTLLPLFGEAGGGL